MINVEVRINGKKGKCEINSSATIEAIKKWICKEFDLNPEDYFLTVSSPDETIDIANIIRSNCIIHINKKVIVDKNSFVDIE